MKFFAEKFGTKSSENVFFNLSLLCKFNKAGIFSANFGKFIISSYFLSKIFAPGISFNSKSSMKMT